MLSVCMIVRDEEENLPRCLESIKGVADEIIVVDTGSKDRTKEIALEYGAKVYDHPWEDNFSLHRNQALGYATKKFVLIIDADEEFFLTDEPEKFKKFLKKLPDSYSTMSILAKDVQGGREVMQFNSARIFRRGMVQYQDRVHNQPKTDGKGGIYEHCFIKHYGYDLTPEKKEAKKQRILKMLGLRLKDNPKDWDAYFYLCQCHAVNGEIDESIAAGETYIEHTGENIKDSVFFTMLRQYMKKGNEQKASEWLNMGIERREDDLDLNAAMVEFGVWTKNSSLIIRGATQYVLSHEKMKKNQATGGNRFVFSFNNEVLAFCFQWLAKVKIEEGKIALEKLKELLPSTADECREKTSTDMVEFGKKLGVISYEVAS